jgi:TonB family protein
VAPDSIGRSLPPMKTRRRPAILTRRSCVRSIPSICLLLAAFAPAQPLFVQQQEMEKIATKLVEAISKAHGKKVLVLEFTDPDGTHPEIAEVLEQELFVALTNSARGFQLADRSLSHALIGPNIVLSLPSDMKAVAKSVKKKTGADSFIVADLWPISGAVQLEIRCLEAPKGKQIAKLLEKIPLTPAQQALFATWLNKVSAPPAGTAGYGIPRCEQCPQPTYTGEAIQAKVSGVVVLRITVTEEGRVTNIRVLKTPGFGLEESAVEQVRKWKLKPATGPDGKPLAVTAVVEVTFRLK